MYRGDTIKLQIFNPVKTIYFGNFSKIKIQVLNCTKIIFTGMI